MRMGRCYGMGTSRVWWVKRVVLYTWLSKACRLKPGGVWDEVRECERERHLLLNCITEFKRLKPVSITAWQNHPVCMCLRWEKSGNERRSHGTDGFTECFGRRRRRRGEESVFDVLWCIIKDTYPVLSHTYTFSSGSGYRFYSSFHPIYSPSSHLRQILCFCREFFGWASVGIVSLWTLIPTKVWDEQK